MKILLVDDDAFLRDMYATKFRESGDEVAVASQSEKVLKMLEEDVYDAIIVDMVMPGLSGTQLIQAIKAIDSAKESVCIVLSNQSEPKDIEEAKQAGAKGYIIKAEAIPSEVVQKVHKLCS